MKKLFAISITALLLHQSQGQTGLGTNAPNSTLDIRGAMATDVLSFTTSISATISRHTCIFKGTSASALTLPDAAACKGRIYWVKNASTTSPVPVLTIQPSASQTIAGSPTIRLDEPNEVIRMVSDGTNWTLFSENVPVRKSGTVSGGWYQGGNTMSAIKALGAITNYDMGFITNNLERMRINTTGFLGEGTSSPLGKLHFVNVNDDTGNDYIFDDYGTTNTSGFFIRKSRGTVAAPQNLQAGDQLGQLRFSARYNGNLQRTDGAGIDAYYQGDGTTPLSDLRFFTSGIEQMRLDQNGFAGLGSSSFNGTNPEKVLVDAGNTSSYNVISGKGSIDNYLQLNIRNANAGTNASSDIVASADNGDESVNYVDMGINSGSYTSTTYPIIAGINTPYLYGVGNDFAIGNGSAGSDLVFFTNGTALTNERMRITSSGNVGIGTGVPADKLTIAGILSPDADNSYSLGRSGAMWTAAWSANGTIQTSDVRLKKDIGPIAYSSDIIRQLEPIHYRWKSHPDAAAKIGFSAQQLQQLVPEVVTEDKSTGALGVNYGELIPVLIKTIQDQQKKMNDLTIELADLESKAGK